MSGNKILIIGAGIAGPVLAAFLKNKGFNPVIYEAYPQLSEAGLSLMLQPNGRKVLALLPGLLERIPGGKVAGMRLVSLVQEKVIVSRDFTDEFSILRGVKRSTFQKALVDYAQDNGIQINWGHKLTSFHQAEDSVTATFENGTKATGSLLIGCDGLHSATRRELFEEEMPAYTGLTQTGGRSKSPPEFIDDRKACLYNFYADGAHMVAYPITDNSDLYSWAVTQREPENKESWRTVDASTADAFKRSGPSEWGYGAGELIKTAENYVKYGLYDRPQLQSWFKGRVTLLGDAAHPTSPHLGQGANQAFEDVYHLVRLIRKHGIPSSAPIATRSLEATFKEFQDLRLERTAMLVSGARLEGENVRVVTGKDACIKRDEALIKLWADERGREEGLKILTDHPFKDQSEI